MKKNLIALLFAGALHAMHNENASKQEACPSKTTIHRNSIELLKKKRIKNCLAWTCCFPCMAWYACTKKHNAANITE